MASDAKRRVKLLGAAAFVVAAGAALYLAFSYPVRTPLGGFPATQPGTARPAGTYFVGGRVKRPGAYSSGGMPVTVRQAILLAGGADEGIGRRSFVTIHRRHPSESDVTELELIKIDLRPLLEEGVKDEVLWPNDQVLVLDKR